jgi:hypothetical protein
MATVAYEKEAHAIAAKNAFDGALAKGSFRRSNISSSSQFTSRCLLLKSTPHLIK